jgi:sulfonate transport system permease protein
VSFETAVELPRITTVGRAWNQRKLGLIRISSPAQLLALWQILSATGVIPQDVLPAPQLIYDAALQLIGNGKLAQALEVSGLRVVDGLLLGGLIGVALAIAVGLSRWFESVVDPSLQMVRGLAVAHHRAAERSTPGSGRATTITGVRVANADGR